MKKILLILFAISCSMSLFARSVNEVKQILIGEWFEENHDKPGWEKYNADGTGSFMVSAFLFEESLGDFTWSLSDENTLVCVLPNNKISRESISIIDNNTILLNGKKYIRRGSKKASSGNSTKPSNNVTHRQNSNSIVWNPVIYDKESFIQAVTHPFGINIQMKDLTLSLLKNFCESNHYTYSENNNATNGTIIHINCQLELFGDMFTSEISFFNSTYNPLRFDYFTINQNNNLESELESIVENLRKWGFDLENRVLKHVDGSEQNEGYYFRIDKNMRGEIYIFDNRIILILDYLNC